MAKKKKWYGVRAGYRTGVFETWDECKLQVDGFKGASFKAFDSQQEALTFVNEISYTDPISQSKALPPTPVEAVALAKNELTGQSAIDFLLAKKRSREEDVTSSHHLATLHGQLHSSSLISNSFTSRSLTGGIGGRLLERAGWSGGGLGAQENGILQPINPIVPSGKRSGLGSETDACMSIEELASPRLSSYCKGGCVKLGFCNCEPPSPLAQPAPPLPFHLQPPLLSLDLSSDQRKFCELAESGCNIFLTGLGGTGKSHALKLAVKILRLKWGGGNSKLGRSAVVLASSTGVSAVSIGGVTLHSAAGCGAPRYAVHFERIWSRKSFWKNMRVCCLHYA